MSASTPSSWRSHLLLNRDARTEAARAEFSRRAARGELVRVAVGAYLPAEVWAEYGERDRFLTKLRVIAAKAEDPITFSHGAAAAAWGLPWFGDWPDAVDVVRSDPGRGQHAGGVRRHLTRGAIETEVIDGLRVTSLARTVVDVCSEPGFIRSIVVGDAALNARTRSGLAGMSTELTIEALRAEALNARSPKRVDDAIGFMNGLAESPGESISRVSIWRAGLPAPVLQHRFGRWAVDFWWPEFDVIGEFDGAVKYLDPAMRGTRSASEVVYAEKLREDELRRHARGFARWGYAEAMGPALLAERLQGVGVQRSRRSRFAASSVI